MLTRADLDDRLAAGNDEHRIAGVSRAQHGHARHESPGLEHLVAQEHEQAEQPEHPKQVQIQRIQPVQIPGQSREQVDDHKQATVSKRVAKHINFNNLMP